MTALSPNTAQEIDEMTQTLTQNEIKSWLSYWAASKSVAVDKIRAFDQVWQARKYCQVMRVGVFVNVTDLQIWNALVSLRQNEKEAA